MGKTLIQKILERTLQRDVTVGEIIELPVDLAWGSEMTLKFAIDALEHHGLLNGSYDKQILSHSDKIMFPFDHLIPATDARSASIMVDLREFADKFGIRVFEVGYDGGIQHRLFEERGFLYPGSIGVGADSHSCTYGALCAMGTGIGSTDLAFVMVSGKTWLQVPTSLLVKIEGKPRAHITGKDIVLYLLGILGVDGATYQSLEFIGDGISHLNMASRFTVSNMAIEGGAKFGLFPSDQITIDYLYDTVAKDFPDEIRFDPNNKATLPILEGDEDAHYSHVVTVDLNELEPIVALPYLPENCLGIYQLKHILKHPELFRDDEVIQDKVKVIEAKADENGEIPIQQVFIGSCTNGRIEDLRVVADIFKGKRVAKSVRVVIVPASQQVYRQALREGIVEILLDSGCYVESSSCGPCIGMKSGVMGKGETAIFTSNRNFYGRTGDRRSFVMLASPAIAATSALSGKLDAPEPFETYYDSEEELVTRLKKYSQERRDVILNSEKIYYHASIKAKESEAQADAKRAWCFGDHINTDLIMPSRFCNVTDPAEYKAFVLLDSQNEEFLETYKNSEYTLKGEFIVSGANFGCGSSRESAPRGILEGGFKCVIAHSFARIFFRNAINIGLPALEIGKAAYEIKQGDKLSVNFQTGEIFNQSQNKVYQAKPMGPFQSKLFESGGLMPYLKEQIKSS